MSVKGNGDFSIGSQIWPGTSKLLEEMGELQQVLGKLIATAGDTAHWSGDLRQKMIDEIADVSAAIRFFSTENFSNDQLLAILNRADEKLSTFQKWHAAPRYLHQKPPVGETIVEWGGKKWREGECPPERTCLACDRLGKYLEQLEPPTDKKCTHASVVDTFPPTCAFCGAQL